MSEHLAIDDKSIDILTSIFREFPQIKEVVLYGSRAKATHQERSDIDLVIRNSEISRQTLGKIKLEIDNSDVPYLVDLQIMENIKNRQLIDHINRVGKVFYTSPE